MSRLDYAPKPKEIQITDIKRGVGSFTPKPDRPVSLSALRAALRKAGYTLDSAEITVTGRLTRDSDAWVLVSEASGQRFSLEGAEVEKALAGAAAGGEVEITGRWESAGAAEAAREIISPRTVRKKGATNDGAAARADAPVRFTPARFDDSGSSAFAEPPAAAAVPTSPVAPPAPIRTTSPGLTVYRGGAIVPRLYFATQRLGGLVVRRQRLQVNASYTPSQRVQLEAELPVSRTSYDDGANSGSGLGLGNLTLWGKYRFFRRVKTFGDRQASARFGLELPTGDKTAPGRNEVNAPAFVRQQLSAVSGGTSARLDLAYSQARRRVIFGGNVEAVVRSERAGFRVGHELRVNTDLEYVLLPLDYERPGGELFLILETTFVHRGLGRSEGRAVPGSRSTEYLLSPGLQYAAAPRWVIEGSYQIPLARDAGPLVLRNGGNLLVGVRYLY